ncbi:hypothetical protein ONA91_25900 [Micromonospora sp. DR5-3]|uniref:hypothetical protein n=1 Tax=unclassified Micromonospora TaxID=2617518 RepID=UPI0011D46CEA|nr:MULTISPECIES: hypothetical protein [unclassified Micromonospora]MCW3817888.1 hypothetical protein [Micromonospora sp. DR5-3]TYC22947.1 hypothetical protein FXF52_17985 [Micromonospora sp. MP36]
MARHRHTIPSTPTRANSPVASTLRISRHAGTILVTLLLPALALTGCGDDIKAAGSSPTPSASPSASPSPSPTPSPTPPSDRDADGIPDTSDTYPDDPKNIPQQVPVNLQCDTESLSGGSLFTVHGGKDGRPDFTEVWAVKPTSCDLIGSLNIVTAIEQQAYKVSKYDEQDISTLYEMCAEVDPDDVYAEAGFAASSEQIPEINAALILCPKHPYAKKWRQAVQRGQADADLEAQGRLFGSGTYRVGKEIKPGTYVTHDVEGCYWERQNSSGNIIDNYFTNGARRVQVTIRSSDYAFNSENCGEWRPAR